MNIEAKHTGKSSWNICIIINGKEYSLSEIGSFESRFYTYGGEFISIKTNNGVTIYDIPVINCREEI